MIKLQHDFIRDGKNTICKSNLIAGPNKAIDKRAQSCIVAWALASGRKYQDLLGMIEN